MTENLYHEQWAGGPMLWAECYELWADGNPFLGGQNSLKGTNEFIDELKMDVSHHMRSMNVNISRSHSSWYGSPFFYPHENLALLWERIIQSWWWKYNGEGEINGDMIKGLNGIGQIFSFVIWFNPNEKLFIAIKLRIIHTESHGPKVTPKAQ